MDDKKDNDKLIDDILNSIHSSDDDKQEVCDDDNNEELEEKDDDINDSEVNEDQKLSSEDIHISKKKHKKKKNYKKLVFGLILSCVIVIIAVFLAVVIIAVGKDFLGVDKDEENVVITIPMGSTVNDISEILKNNNIIEYPFAFTVVSKLQGADSYIAGEHVVRPNMAYETLIKELQSDAIQKKESIDVTFPEGKSLYECAVILEQNDVCNADEFIKVFNTSDFGYDFESKVKNSADKFYKMEGYCFPDTYTFFKDSEPEIVAKKIYQRYSEMVNPNIMGRIDDLNMSLDEVMSFASVVQAEAPTKEQMRRVASVFWNRLKDPDEYPKLQSDPTRKYVEDIIMPNIDLPNEKMYAAYNTYEGNGLPPGAICNPGIDAIEAVLYPEETNYYYFCSDLNTRQFFYAETLKEHEQNLVKAGLK